MGVTNTLSRKTVIVQQVMSNPMTTLYVSTLTCISQYSIISPNLAGQMIHLGALIIKIMNLIPKTLLRAVWKSVLWCLFSTIPWWSLWSGGFGKYCRFQTWDSDEGILAAGDLGDIQILSLVVVLLITGRIMEQSCHRCHKLSISRHSTVLSKGYYYLKIQLILHCGSLILKYHYTASP